MKLLAWLHTRRTRVALRAVEAPPGCVVRTVRSPEELAESPVGGEALVMFSEPFADWEALSAVLSEIMRALCSGGRVVALLEPQDDTPLKESETALRLLTTAGFERVTAYRAQGLLFLSAHKPE